MIPIELDFQHACNKKFINLAYKNNSSALYNDEACLAFVKREDNFQLTKLDQKRQ